MNTSVAGSVLPADVDEAESTRLIDRWIVPDPHRPGADEVVVREYGVPVYALVAYYLGAGQDVERAAHDCHLSAETVQAAVAYYRRHRTAIEGRIAADAA
jgi:uncharacterized protein (DUF433 family)